MKQLKLMITVFALGAMTLVSCNTDNALIPEHKGRLNVHLTDAPFPIDLISSTEVRIDKLEIRKKAEAEADEDSFMVISEQTVNINLLDLTNGVTELLTTVDLDPGYYDMIRMHVVDANITLKDGTTYNLKVPSGDASGLKIMLQPAVYIEAGVEADVLLDFDVSRSFVVKGNVKGKITGFNFKPVVRGIFLKHAGSIEGIVINSEGDPLENAMVQVYMPSHNDDIDDDENEDGDDDELKSGSSNDDSCYKGPVSAFTNEEGKFKIIGLPGGSYTVICSIDGFVSDTLTDVKVANNTNTVVNFELLPAESVTDSTTMAVFR